MNINQHVSGRTDDECRAVLAKLLEGYLKPAFGTLPKREIDLLFYEALEALGIVEHEPTIYGLVQRLHVTRSKARTLLYDVELRRWDSEMLDSRVRRALRSPLIQKEGEMFVLEIENPLELDHVRSIIQHLGHVSDGSFLPSLVKLKPAAFAALTDHFLTEKEKLALKAALVKTGCVAETTLRAMLTATLKRLGTKIASDTGEALADKVSKCIAAFVDGAGDKACEAMASIFGAADEETF